MPTALVLQGCLVYRSAGRRSFEQQGQTRVVANTTTASSATNVNSGFDPPGNSADSTETAENCSVLSSSQLFVKLSQATQRPADYSIQKINSLSFFVCEK